MQAVAVVLAERKQLPLRRAKQLELALDMRCHVYLGADALHIQNKLVVRVHRVDLEQRVVRQLVLPSRQQALLLQCIVHPHGNADLAVGGVEVEDAAHKPNAGLVVVDAKHSSVCRCNQQVCVYKLDGCAKVCANVPLGADAALVHGNH